MHASCSTGESSMEGSSCGSGDHAAPESADAAGLSG